MTEAGQKRKLEEEEDLDALWGDGGSSALDVI
jgi:hypothetical protein